MLNIEVKNFLEFFSLQITVDSGFFTVSVWSPTIFGHAKFEIKNFLEFFNLQRSVDSEFFTGGVLGTNFVWSLKN